MTLELGYHTGKAISGAPCLTSQGRDQVAVEFEFIGGPNDGKRSTWYGSFTEKSADRTLESLMVAGWDGESLERLDGLGTTQVTLVVESDTYGGEARNRIAWVNRMQGSGPAIKQRMDAGRAQSLTERMRGRVMKLKQEGAAPAAAAPAAGYEDEIPFK